MLLFNTRVTFCLSLCYDWNIYIFFNKNSNVNLFQSTKTVSDQYSIAKSAHSFPKIRFLFPPYKQGD